MISHLTPPILSLILLAQLAAAEPALNPTWWQPIAQTGAIGGCLIWFMYWGVKLIRELTRALNLNTRATMVAVMALEHIDEATRLLATKIKMEAEEDLANAPETPARRRQ